jgi:beta-glucanase (GH16 family)
MKHSHWVGVAVAVFLVADSSAATAAESGKSCEFRPILLEEFDEETAPNRRIESITSQRLGPARWTAHTPWNGDFGDAQFVDPHPRGPFSMKEGILSITASKNSEGKWTSGLIAAADSTGAGTGTRYGYFEARMKIPPGPGTWPAFWLAALKPADKRDGNVEIDVIEYYGQFTDSYRSVVHVWFADPTKHRGKDEKIEVPRNSLVDDYHTFGVDVSPQAIVFFHDGKRVWSQPTPPELTYPLYPLVNLALGSGWPIDKTPNPSTLLVDYVHVFGRDAGPPEGCPPGPPPKP